MHRRIRSLLQVLHMVREQVLRSQNHILYHNRIRRLHRIVRTIRLRRGRQTKVRRLHNRRCQQNHKLVRKCQLVQLHIRSYRRLANS